MKALLRLDRTTPDLRGRWSHARLTAGVIVLLVGSTGTTWSQESIGSTVIVINTVEGSAIPSFFRGLRMQSRVGGRSDGSPLTSPHPQISGSEMPSKRASPAQSRPFWPSVLAE